MKHTHTDPSITEGEEHLYQYNRIRFWLNGQAITEEIPPAQTTLEYLHQTQQLFGTKCSCNEGDCGACTVVIASVREGRIVYEAVNSCLFNAAKLHGKHLITVEGIGTPDSLHPIQTALLDFHGTQCGYCTPGFVMSLFALLASHRNPDQETILAALEGNLCRCTGYDSILKAASYLAGKYAPEQIVPQWCRALEPALLSFHEPAECVSRSSARLYPCQKYCLPRSLSEFDALREQEPDAILISGGTDIMVQMNIQRRHYPVLIDLSCLSGLDGITETAEGILIGANVSYSQLLESTLIKAKLPALQEIIRIIASKQIRNFATLVGNIANASPIGDSLPLLLVLGAFLHLHSRQGERILPLQDFFLAYRQTALQSDELITGIHIPFPPQGVFIRTLKAAKRNAVDISSVSTAVLIHEEAGIIRQTDLACGGVAAIPKLSLQFRKAMLNMELQGLHPEPIADFVAKEFTPISDVRGSSDYRSRALRNQVLKYLNEFLQGRKP